MQPDDHPYRTEMSLVLSYDGQKSKYTSSPTPEPDKAQEPGTPPPNLPQAMKLLPNKLAYASTAAHKPDNETDGHAKCAEQIHVNNENSANETIHTNAQIKLIVTDDSKTASEKGSSSHDANNDDDYSVAGTSNENHKSTEKLGMVSVRIVCVQPACMANG